jgi:hypothetical protein
MDRRPREPMTAEFEQDDLASEAPGGSGGERAKAVAGSAGEQARQVAGTAADQAKEVAEQAGEQVRRVAQEAGYQLRNLTGQARDQLGMQARAQTERVSENIRRWSDQAEALAEGRTDEAGPMTDYVLDLSGRLSGWADRLDGGGFEGVISQVQAFARRRPMAFIGLSALAGFALSRVGKSLRSEPPRPDGQVGQMLPPSSGAVPEPVVAPVTSPLRTPATERSAEPWPEEREPESVVILEQDSTAEPPMRRR